MQEQEQQLQFTTLDSLEALISICPSKEEEQGSGGVYSREFQAMLDSLESEDCAEETGLGSEKKRRLSIDQVRALEKYFEVENKLDPDRKLKLAEELGLQPRQVAIWFQNRRARWKTKQLERDFRLLKANYDSLNVDFTTLQQQKQQLSAELEELREKVERQNSEHSGSPEQSKSGGYCDFKDKGSSDSDSNVIFNEESGVAYNAQPQLMSAPPTGTGFQAATNWFQSSDLRRAQQQLVKMEDQSLFSSEESCNIYLVDHPPTLHWYFQH